MKNGQKLIDNRPTTRYNVSNLIEILINHYREQQGNDGHVYEL